MQFLIAHIGHTGRADEHVEWWAPRRAGYTICIDKAGKYTEDEARDICRYASSIAIPVQVVESLSRGTPHFRNVEGRLSRLYDGGPHRVVENRAVIWKKLMAAKLVCSKTTEKPTPMPDGKARSIYLDPAPDCRVATDTAAGVPSTEER